MKVVFKVSNETILVIEISDNSIKKVDIISKSLTQATFPAALDHHKISHLTNLLRVYTNSEVNQSVEEIAKKYDGEISFIEFKPNLTIHFQWRGNKK